MSTKVMTEVKWNIGDVVQLRSGGPRMTVTQLGLTHGRVECSWFVADTELRSAFIHSQAVVRVSDAQ
ncbi:YodC family protein [Paenalcaligenes sp. Me131]|uniref:YodC family protein n=1 Tax=unclassified Paenalcaligenes TaxID=2685726 RepID=UPI003D2CC342